MGYFRGGSVWLGEIRQTVEPAVTQSGFQRLSQRHEFLVHGVVRGRLSSPRDRFLQAVDAVFLNLAGGDFGEARLPKKGTKCTFERECWPLT